jgi:hypothetical protein
MNAITRPLSPTRIAIAALGLALIVAVIALASLQVLSMTPVDGRFHQFNPPAGMKPGTVGNHDTNCAPYQLQPCQ